jgi:aspartyl-tRNA(Asn)/glutamyl-tRNA(Gln) amidotransferase subunit A
VIGAHDVTDWTIGSLAEGRFSRLTRTISPLGLPALSVPCGFSTDDRPIGIQLIGRPFDEVSILRLAHAYEQAAGWHTRKPPLA